MTADAPQTNLPAARRSNTGPRPVTGRVKAALDAMVWESLPRKEASEKAGLLEHSLYKALRRPPVRAYYLEQCEVLRLSGRAKRLHRLEQLADQDENRNAAVAAIKVAEQLGEGEGALVGQPRTPGVVIVIQQAARELPAEGPILVIEGEAVEQYGTTYGADPAPSRRIAPEGMAAAPKQRFLDYD